jgi:23S rRNA (guanosine2251-2'-O)-methyltransferase
MDNRKLSTTELNRISAEEFKQAEKTPLILVLDNIRSMHNIGSVFRSADSFRLHSLLLCGLCAKPPHREIEKTALGATQTVDWSYTETAAEAIRQLRAIEATIICIEQTSASDSLTTFRPEKGKLYAFVLGNEITGVQEAFLKASEQCLEIEQYGSKHSLNVAVCAGIAAYDFCSKIKP